MTDLDAIILNLGKVFPIGVKVVFYLIIVFGMVMCAKAVFQVYLVGRDGERSNHSYGAAFCIFVLGAACCVSPVLVWRIANTIALGGKETAQWLSYIPSSTGMVDTYCKDTQFAITGFFMLTGAISILYGITILYNKAQNYRQTGTGQATIFIISGVACMFINDIATIIGNTINWNVGIQNACHWFGT